MFTGFASENTPAIQVWDFFRTYASSAAPRSISLSDDCAPIQFFQTGASSTAIKVYLPTCPIEGKQITIINARYNTNNQSLAIYSSDTSGTGSNNLLYTLGLGGSLVLTYSKNLIALGPNSFGINSGWIALNQSPVSADNAYSVLIGGNQNTSAGNGAVVVGGQINTNNSSYGSIVGGTNNVVSNSFSSVVGGTNNTASGAYAAVVGGQSSTASGIFAAVIGGSGASASSSYGAAIGGNGTTSNGQGSICMGGRGGTTRGITGNVVFPASYGPINASAGVSQAGMLVLATQTTTDTATRIRSDDNSAGTTNQVILPNNSAYYVKGSIIATVTGGGNTKSWDFIATIKRGANAAATSIVGAVTLNVQAADAGASTWVVAITADTTNGGLAVTVTGQAATTIRWVAKLESTEVTY